VIACLVGKSARLSELAGQFSPVIEKVGDGSIVFSVDGLGSLFGNVFQIAAEIARRGAQMESMPVLRLRSINQPPPRSATPPRRHHH